MIIAGTGHRPNRLGGYSTQAADRVYNVAFEELLRIRPKVVISGMALGWDQALAQAALDQKRELWAYVPFEGQEQKWPVMAREHYWRLRHRAAKTVVVCPGGYAAWKMQKRNEAMVDAADAILALWSGDLGGTANCVFYAQRKKKRVHNCWSHFAAGLKQPDIFAEREAEQIRLDHEEDVENFLYDMRS